MSVLALLGIAIVAASALQAQEKKAEETLEWVPAAAQNNDQEIDPDARRLDVVITSTPKATADMSTFTREYVIDLARFSITNTGKNPLATAKGINAALQHAKTIGANRIVFPRGTYLISETVPIVFDHTDTIVDLNGCTLQMNPNALKKCHMAIIDDGAENFRLTNGTLRGERDKHDFKATKGSGEWVDLLHVNGGRDIEVDHLLLTHATGKGVRTLNGISGKGGKQRYHYIHTKNLESGGFAENGTKVEAPEKTRTINPYDIAKANGQFEFGYTAGYMGFPYVKGRRYQACFYADDMTFIEKNDYIQYKKRPVPKGAKWIHLEFNQPEVLGVGSDGSVKNPYCGFISNFRSPRGVHFHHNHMLKNRQLGMAVCGGQQWIIENNVFEENGPQAPGYGVDFEDGWLMTQDIVFRNNRFKNNIKGDFVVCGGSELLVEGNEFEKGAYFWDATLSYTFRKNKVMGGRVAFKTRTGHVTAEDNYYENCTMLVRFDPRGFNNGFFREKGVLPETPPVRLRRETLVNVRSVAGTYFDFADSTMKHVVFHAGKETQLARFHDCVFEDTSVSYSAEGPAVIVERSGCKGTLKEQGPGLKRRKSNQNP